MKLTQAQIRAAKHVLWNCVDCHHLNRAKIVKWDINMRMIEIEPTRCGGLMGVCSYTYFHVEFDEVKKLE